MAKHTGPILESAHDILRQGRRPLDVFFSPKNVAVIGATDREGSIGKVVLRNLTSNAFRGTVFPVNPNRQTVLGIKAYPNIAAVPEKVDLAVIVTPAPTVPGIVGECARAGVKGTIIMSAGFKERGAEGAGMEREILEKARQGGMRIIGPNCLGVMYPPAGLNATFTGAMAQTGSIGFVSQSGALCTAILDWSFRENVGFSAFVSIGSMADVGWGDLIDYLGNDPHTKSILIYMESIGDARSFLSSAREVALTKPIIILKAGRTEAAAKAAASHTGSLTGSDKVLDAAFHRCGVLRVNSIAALFNMAEVLAKQPRPAGPRLMILTNAGGPGVLATDALIAGGGELAVPSKETIEGLNELLPPYWSHGNPIDILGDADPERYAKSIEIAAKDPNSDGLLVILTPQAMTDPTQTAERVKQCVGTLHKPVLASLIGGEQVAGGEKILNQANIPVFSYPDTAARIFNDLWRYSYNLHALYETPMPLDDSEAAVPDRAAVEKVIQSACRSNRTILTEVESKQILAAYGIPTVKTLVATSKKDAVIIAEKIGYPVVLKIFSETVTHKTDVGGVKLNLRDADAVGDAFDGIKSAVQDKAGAGNFLGVTIQPMIRQDGYELIIGSSIDPQFGPVLLFGYGGQLVEIFKDHALGLPPLNTTLARRMMEQTRIYAAFKGVRGRKPIDLAALEQILVRFSHLVVEHRRIKEIDVNPLLASAEQIIALDARVVLHGVDVGKEQLPRPAIRPYPRQYVKPWMMKDGRQVTIRPIRPEDEQLMVKFHEALSEDSVYSRYFQTLGLGQRVAHERLARICFLDYDREMALVVERSPDSGPHEILAVGRLFKPHGTNEAEFAMLVTDRYQGLGLGSELLGLLLQVGRDEKIRRITADILPGNLAMQRICEKLGFRLHHTIGEDVVKADISL
jgi:acetyltransferase